MTDTYDLSKLGTEAFENIVNFLALKTLGLGTTGFCPGADGGRDGYFEGEAPYPSDRERWDGSWYIQSKFHAPHLSKDPQKWLVAQVEKEIKRFEEDDSDRIWPNNWIIATNIDPSGKPDTGSFDKIRKLLNESELGKAVNLNIWGGRRILDMLALHGDIATYYGHLLTPGHVISSLYSELNDSKASIKEIIHYFVSSQFTHHTYSKLDQAGSSTDDRPGVHDLFIDLPFNSKDEFNEGLLSQLCKTSTHSHRYSLRNQFPQSWKKWMRHSKRARVVLVKGGPGQGKSTVGQYLCQIHRAFLILSDDGPRVVDATRELANQVRVSAEKNGFWPATARIPMQIELKEFAHWYSQRESNQSCDVITYLSEIITKKIGTAVYTKTIKNALAKQSWIVVFDGLDEVPNDSKSDIAGEVLYFLNDVVIELDADVFALCTSRPQGYSGQFSGLDGPTVELNLLSKEQAMDCAKPLLRFGRNEDEAEKSIEILIAAINSPNVRELMTTPLQSHIMAVVVRDGGRPPERRWQLFNSFYLVMKKRESLKDFKNPRIAKLLREDDLLLKSVHMRLGFVLHAKAERSEGAQTTLNKDDFRKLVRDVVTELVEHEVDETVEDVMEATTERLVLVSTPESGEEVRFDIRQLQEFFASEFIHTEVDPTELGKRIETIAGDQHWREVMHFLMSALIENQRTLDVSIAIEELRKLNEGVQPNSLYHRRASKAVPLCNRLILEGVLEQDLRVRHRIKPLLDPIGGKLDLESLKDLIHIKPINSKHWLIQILLEKISISSEHEYVGALYLLAWLLPDTHPDVSVVKNKFLNLDTQVQESLIVLWADNNSRIFRRNASGESENNLSYWILGVAIKILNSIEWWKYSKESISGLLKICFKNKQRFVAACEVEGINPHASDVLSKVWQSDMDHISYKSSDSLKIGFIIADLFSESWKTGTIPSRIKDIEPEKSLDSLDGYFELMILCASYSRVKDNRTLVKIINIFDSLSEDNISCLPRFLLAMIPVPSWHDKKSYCVEHLRKISHDSNGVTEAERAGLDAPLMSLSINADVDTTVESWIELATRLPAITISLLLNDRLYLSSLSNDSVSQALSNPIIEKTVLENSDLTFNYIGGWGILSETNPELLFNLKEQAKKSLHKKINNYPVNISPFLLDLPDDAQLLPFIAQVFIRSIEQQKIHRDLDLEEESKLEKLYSCYGLKPDTLRSISKSNEFDNATRSGALALYWLSLNILDKKEPRELITISSERGLYKKLVNSCNEKWLVKSLIFGVLISSKESDEDVLDFVSDLLENCHNSNGVHKELVKLFRVWQERSNTPVYCTRALAKWLGYNFITPNYVD